MTRKAITDADMDRAERLRTAREHAGLNQSELARKMKPKVSPQTVQQWEKGGGISGKYQVQLATALSVTPEWLLFGNVNHGDTISRGNDVRPTRAVRLEGSTVATALAAIEWRLALVDLKFDVAEAPEVFALALTWALEQSADNLRALQTALQDEISRQQGKTRAAPKEDQRGSTGTADDRPRPSSATGGKRRK